MTVAEWAPAVIAIAGVSTGVVVFINLRRDIRKEIRAESEWKGKVNADIGNFQEFMAEVRADIKRIFLRLEPEVASRRSPLRLTDLGKKVSAEIEAAAWAARTAPTLTGRIDGMEAYDIQEFSFIYADDELELTDEQQSLVKQAAYGNGLAESTVRRVMAFELRDQLLDLAGLEQPDEKTLPPPTRANWSQPQQWQDDP